MDKECEIHTFIGRLYHYYSILLQVTWARCEETYRNRPYSVLTLGDQNFVDDKRFFVSKPQSINKKHVSKYVK